jgi:hypothetical protein
VRQVQQTQFIHKYYFFFIFFLISRQPLGGLGRLIFRGFTITLFRHTTLGKTPLEEGSARRRDLYLTTHNTHKRQTSMSPVGLEPTIPVSERPQTHALDRTATGIGHKYYSLYIIITPGTNYSLSAKNFPAFYGAECSLPC